jgi:hypothetical protein
MESDLSRHIHASAHVSDLTRFGAQASLYASTLVINICAYVHFYF